MSEPIIALTGSTGFVGRQVLRDLQAHGYQVRVLLRHPVETPLEADSAVIGDLAMPMNLSQALAGVDAVIHSAGLAHTMSGRPEVDYRAINTDATLALARAAERAGVRRFIFLSSVRAQTGPTAIGVLDETAPPRPTDAYGRSKLEAEEQLAPLSLDWAALRPVLVYGPGVRGNMEALVRLAATPYPLPFGLASGRRSLVAVENLASAVRTLLTVPGPLKRPFLVADDAPLTVGEMIAALRAGFGRAPMLLPVPKPLLALAARAAGRGDAIARLTGDLVVDPSALRALGWKPEVDTRAGLKRLAAQITEERAVRDAGLAG